jgi:molybdopterin-containing oxidoreductase family membrane subunit
VLCKRIWLLFTSFITPNVYGGAGITLGNANVVAGNGGSIWTDLGIYAPTAVEIVIALAVVSLGALAFIVLSNKLMNREGQ